MPGTIKDVARITGLSPSTVSRALNKSGYVSDATQRRVDEAVAHLGYQPNWMARGLRGKPSGLIALIIPDISNTFYTAVAQAVSENLRARHYEMMLCVNNEDPEVDLHYLQILRQKRADGILYVHPARGSNSTYLRQVVSEGLPVVELNRQRERDLLDAVLADNYQGAYQMTRHLIEMGHTRIGLVLGEMDLTTGKNRYEGWRRALEDAGLVVDPLLARSGAFTRAYGEQAAHELLTLADPPTVIFAGSNRLLMGCLSALESAHLQVPDDISVVAFNNSEWLGIWRPPITAVDVAADEMARLAVELLLRRVTGEQGVARKPVTYQLSTSLIVRASCKQLAAASPVLHGS